MSRTLTLEGDITAADTPTQLTSQGSITSPSRLTPQGANAIKHIYASVAHDGAAAGGAVFLARFGGNAIQGGDQELVLAAGGHQDGQSGSDEAAVHMPPVRYLNADIEITGGDILDIEGEMAGSDLGTATIVVTVVFGNIPKGSGKLYRTREGEATAIDQKSQLTTIGSKTSPNALTVPSGTSQLSAIIVASAGNHAAAQASSGLIRLEGPGLKNGPEVVAAGSTGIGQTTGGNNVSPAVILPLGIETIRSQEILLFGEMQGSDPGAVSFGATLVFV